MSQIVRIVHIIDEMKTGGAQTHLVTMLRHLQQQYSFDHHVIGLFEDGPIANNLREMEINVSILNLREDFSHKRFDLAISKITSELRNLRPDLVEAHLTWSRLLGLLAAKRLGIHKRIGFEQGDIYMNSLIFQVANFCSQVYTDRYIVCSRALSQWVHETHHINYKKLSVFHNCVDIDKFNPYVLPANDILTLKTADNMLFAMVGTLGSGVNKRVDVGIRAIAIARQEDADISLIIVGDGNQRIALEKLAQELDIADYVHFLGMRSDVPNILSACDAFCHAAPFEPFGIVALEAMATGLPVIVPDSGGIKEAVKHNSTGLIYPALDVDALAKSMTQLSKDKSIREEMGKQAYCSVVNQFTVKQYVERLYNLYGLIS